MNRCYASNVLVVLIVSEYETYVQQIYTLCHYFYYSQYCNIKYILELWHWYILALVDIYILSFRPTSVILDI